MIHTKKLSYILIAGPSGSGKDTAVNHIIKDNDFKACFETYKFYTNRPKRNNLDNGYYFSSDREMNQFEIGKISDRSFLVKNDTIWRYIWNDKYLEGYVKTRQTDDIPKTCIVLPVTTTQIMDFLIYVSLHYPEVSDVVSSIQIINIIPNHEKMKENLLNRTGTSISEIYRRMDSDKDKYLPQVFNRIKSYALSLKDISCSYIEIENNYDYRFIASIDENINLIMTEYFYPRTVKLLRDEIKSYK